MEKVRSWAVARIVRRMRGRVARRRQRTLDFAWCGERRRRRHLRLRRRRLRLAGTSMLCYGKLWRAGGAALLLFGLAQGIALGSDLTKDDIDFRKNVYVDKEGHRLPYRLYVPLGYDSNRKYPLLLWLHGGRGRGSDNGKQLNGAAQIRVHLWAGQDVQLKFPMFELVPQCPSGDNWSDPDLNQPTKWLELTMSALAEVEKEFSIDPGRIYLAGQSMGGLG